MKKTLATLTLLAGAVSGYSQGQVVYADYLKTDFSITIWQVQPGGGEVQGNSTAGLSASVGANTDKPVGTTAYSGIPLGGIAADTTVAPTDYGDGAIWSAQLYSGAGTVASFSGLSAVAGTVASFFVNDAALGYAGEFNASSAATIPLVPNGSPATFAIAAWYNGGGAYTSLAAAQAAAVPWGTSTLGTENVNGSPNTPPDLPAIGGANTLSGGITSFSVATVPEPSTIALGVIGASAFLMRLRRK
jgi:hypothetical protein